MIPVKNPSNELDGTLGKPLDFFERMTPLDLRLGRRAAVQYLYQIDLHQDWFFNSTSFESFCHQNQVSKEQFDFVKTLVSGVISQVSSLDKTIARHCFHWKLYRMARVDLSILRVCTWEIQHRPQLAVSVIIADAIEISEFFGTAESKSFINGVLDSIAKNLRQKP